jgi:2-polyprenyl-3-methyl-5-hydroxy-6-metoxy-1,4-benzoquinol methylase
MGSRQEAVRELFENTAQYLKFDYNLRIRKETVEAFTKDLYFKNVLDMPCGNGEISIPLRDKADHLLLMDLSSNMCRLASENTPVSSDKFDVENADFFSYDFNGQKFDLIICLGLLAHAESPKLLLDKLIGRVQNAGHLIIQNTDASHFYNYLIRIYLGIKNIFRKQSYPLNKVSGSYIENYLSEKGFTKVRQFRYNQSFLGFSNLFSNEKKYSLTKSFFGNAENPRHQSWGSDVTYLFKKTT